MATEPPKKVISIQRQKDYIIENVHYLNRATKISLLSVVMMEIGQSVVSENGIPSEAAIDLSAVEKENSEVITQMYNIVRARMEILKQPARPGNE